MALNKLKKAFIILLSFLSIETFAQTKGKTENVILITFDGLRWQELFKGADSVLINDKTYVEDTAALKKDFWAATPLQRREKLMPFFWNVIAKEGQLYGNRAYDNKVNVSNNMWFSYPGYNEILTGSHDDERINSNDKIDNPNKTVLEFLNEQKEYKGRVAAFGSWDVFPFIINEKRSEIPVNAGFEAVTGELNEREKFLNILQTQIPSPWSSVRLDAFTHHFALEYLKKKKPKVLYIAYGETDDFAHGGKYDAYLKSARQTDAFIKEIWDWVQSSPEYKDKTSIIITTDHGRGDIVKETWKHHGTKIKDASEIWMAFIGPDSKPLGEVKSEGQLYQSQVAATIAAMLGKEYKSEKQPAQAVSGALGKKLTSVAGQ